MKNKQLVSQIRSASRQLIRELGFMKSTIADTGLSPSAVHAIIEIDKARRLSGRDLSELLMLEKSSTSRLTKNLLDSAIIKVQTDPNDARLKLFELTNRGKSILLKINKFADNQVMSALTNLGDSSCILIRNGIQDYAYALRDASGKKSNLYNNNEFTIKSGYVNGVIARIVEMQMNYYSTFFKFGSEFEACLATGIGEFITRIDRPRNSLWTVQHNSRIVASIAIDAQDIGNKIAHLRWFIVDDTYRGIGIGKKLLIKALEFSDKNQFKEIQLWTFKGLDTARSLYESNGFKLAQEKPGQQWGKQVLEQRFVRKAA